MSSPDALPIVLGAPAAPTRNPLEKLADGPFSGDEKAAFSTAMLEASAPAGSASDAASDAPSEAPVGMTPDETAAEGGKGLPALPVETTLKGRLQAVPVVDPKLEEFAVGMGIDRGLARLLLMETAPDAITYTATAGLPTDAVPNDAAGIEDTETDPALLASIAPMWIAATPPAVVRTVMMPDAGAEEGAAPDVAEPDGAAPAVVASMGIAPAVAAPIVDEDLLSWRARMTSEASMRNAAAKTVSLSAAPTAAPTMEPVAVAAAPAAAASPAAASLAAATAAVAAPIVDEDLLSWRARMTFGAAGVAIAPKTASPNVAPPVSAAPVVEPAPVPVALPEDTVARLRTRATAAPAAITALDTASVLLGGGERLVSGLIAEPLSERDPDSASVASAPTERPTMPSTMSMISLPGSVDRLSMGTAAATAGEASRTLDVPDARLKFGERVQAFADAVAQRVLGQIRDDNWSVRMQLHPADLGTMDIDLTLRGSAVAATVGVANGEVRALLESGLPRLRESLESAGLQLAGWNFNQSGSRAFSEPSRRTLPQGGQRLRNEEADPVIEAGAARSAMGVKTGSGAVDLFV